MKMECSGAAETMAVNYSTNTDGNFISNMNFLCCLDCAKIYKNGCITRFGTCSLLGKNFNR